jgi:hypothetical protein
VTAAIAGASARGSSANVALVRRNERRSIGNPVISRRMQQT